MSQLNIAGTKAVIFDRDGVINVKRAGDNQVKYVLNPDELIIYEDFLDFANWLSHKSIRMFVATNQQAISLDYLDVSSLNQIHDKIQTALRNVGAHAITHFYVCPHLPDTCQCRKPAPGLLTKLMLDYGYNASELLFVGDSISDKLAAGSVNIHFLQIKRGRDKIFDTNFVDSLRQLIGEKP